MAVPGVVGTAIGVWEGAPCIQVLVADPRLVEPGRLPGRIGAYVVRVIVTGPIRPR
jgi:hypothetical protein